MNYGQMQWMMGDMFGIGLLGFLIEILIIIVLVLLAVFLFKQIQKK